MHPLVSHRAALKLFWQRIAADRNPALFVHEQPAGDSAATSGRPAAFAGRRA